MGSRTAASLAGQPAQCSVAAAEGLAARKGYGVELALGTQQSRCRRSRRGAVRTAAVFKTFEARRSLTMDAPPENKQFPMQLYLQVSSEFALSPAWLTRQPVGCFVALSLGEREQLRAELSTETEGAESCFARAVVTLSSRPLAPWGCQLRHSEGVPESKRQPPPCIPVRRPRERGDRLLLHSVQPPHVPQDTVSIVNMSFPDTKRRSQVAPDKWRVQLLPIQVTIPSNPQPPSFAVLPSSLRLSASKVLSESHLLHFCSPLVSQFLWTTIRVSCTVRAWGDGQQLQISGRELYIDGMPPELGARSTLSPSLFTCHSA